MLRPLIFALSRNKSAELAVTSLPGLRGLSRRFVAGETQQDALAAVRRLNRDGFEATVSFLGEEVTSHNEVRRAVDEFVSCAAALMRARLRSHISIKLTQLGLAFDRALAERALETVLQATADAHTFVRIDMEDSRYTDATLQIFADARRHHGHVGIVIQASLRRSEDDIVALAREGAPVRLVKGAYLEPPTIAYRSKRDVDAAYARLLDAYFDHMTEGGWLAVATHDGRMVRATLRAAAARSAPGDRFEFQMLYGIRADMQRALREQGHRVRVYVPYGSHWYPYLMRRLAERPANLWFFLRNAFRR